jgi:hypothetical protein
MPEQIICVKIAQKIIAHKYESISAKNPTTYSIFPYDRVYLAKKDQKDIFKRLFRYYLSMPLDVNLLNALNRLRIGYTTESPIRKDKYKSQKRRVSIPLGTSIEDAENWIMVVPTHIYTKRSSNSGQLVSQLDYCVTKAIDGGHNENVQMPRATLHTPEKEIPFICAVCTNIPILRQ